MRAVLASYSWERREGHRQDLSGIAKGRTGYTGVTRARDAPARRAGEKPKRKKVPNFSWYGREAVDVLDRL